MAMRTITCILGALIVVMSTLGAAAPIRVMLLDGESAGSYHDWQRTTPVLRKILEETGLFEVSESIHPADRFNYDLRLQPESRGRPTG